MGRPDNERARLELVCPAGTPAALRAAVEAGAHAVYCGFRNETNARNFPGLNFSETELVESVRFAHARGARVFVAINTFARAGAIDLWRHAVDAAATAGADAIIAADLAVLDHVATRHPGLRLHLSVQAAAGTPQAIRFYTENFGVKRVILPRVLSVQEIARLNREIDVETEVFVFGGLCVMAEGRCSLSSYVTGKSPNLMGVCSPPSHVAYAEQGGTMSAKLGGFTIDRFELNEAAGYPTLCKGRFVADGETSYLFEDPVSLNAADLLLDLSRAGVKGFKIEGRQRGKAYVSKVVKAFRTALDSIENGETPTNVARPLAGLVEGGRETAGAYRKVWR